MKKKERLVVSVIIPYYNKYSRLIKTLEGLSKQSVGKESFEVIVVDDGSEDEILHRSEITALKSSLNLNIIRIKNSGRSIARNTGIVQAKADLLVFLDDDVIIPDHYLERHQKYHENGEKIFVHSNVTDDYQMYFEAKYSGMDHKKREEKLQRVSRYLKKVPVIETLCKSIYQDDIITNFDWMGFITCNVSVEKECILHAGMFSDEFRNWGCEDFELGLRLCKQGYRLLYDDLPILHLAHSDRTLESIQQSFYHFYQMHPVEGVKLLELIFSGEITIPELMDKLREISAKENKIRKDDTV